MGTGDCSDDVVTGAGGHKGLYPAQVVIWVVLAFVNYLPAQAQKNDTVYLVNGDRITGELKKYENGLLVLSTEGISTINIEYDKIRTIYSNKYYEIVSASGFSYYGSIQRSETPGYIGIGVLNDTISKPIREIVEIVQIEKRFWSRFYGSIDLGVSFLKSTNTFQYNFNTEINYRARKDLLTLGINLLSSIQKVSDSSLISQNNDVGLQYSHFFQGKWWGGVGGRWQENTELDLASRFQLMLAAGYDIVHTNPVRLYIMGGALVNREKPTDSVAASTNFEAVASTKISWLQHRHPKINISSNFNVYPSLSVSGRVRLEYNLSVKYELFSDFYINLSFYDDYDNKPAGGEAAVNDWSVIFSIGYKF